MRRENGEVRLGRALVLAGILAAGAAMVSCTDNLPTSTAGSQVRSETPAPSQNLIALKCTASRLDLTVSCAEPNGSPTETSANGKRYSITYGGQNLYVQLVSSGVSYSGGVFSFAVTVKNMIPQNLGANSTGVDSAGVKVFFFSGPTVTGGTGVITVGAGSQLGSFTGPNQPYYKYSGTDLGVDSVLSNNETSAPRTWSLNMPGTVNTFAFTLLVAAEVPKPNGYIDLSVDSAYVLTGLTRNVKAVVRNALGDSVGTSVTSWVSSDNTSATVSPSGVVTGVAPDFVTITANAPSISGSISMGVCQNMAVGSVYSIVMPKASRQCFGGGGAGAEYTYMPVNLSTSGALSFSVTGTGIQAVTGPPNPDLRVSHTILAGSGTFAQGPALDIASDLPILEQDAQHYNALLANRPRNQNRAAGPRYNITGRDGITPHYNIPPNVVPGVGTLMTLNSNSACSGSPSLRTGQVKSVSQHLIVVSDTANPAGGFTTAQYDSIALEFDSIAWPVDSANFGAPTDLDNNQHVVAFFTRAVNELSPAASSSVVLGFFATKDVFGTDDCSNSNGQATVGGEIFYMLVPDPTGAVNSNVRTNSFVRGNTTGTLGHEFQHMINGMRRAYITGASFFEEGYLNEGLSHIAEELMFYRTSAGLAPRQNIQLSTLTTGPNASVRVAAFNTYANQNFGRFRSWLQRPDTAGAFRANANSLAVRGAIWSFLRYAADRVNGNDQTFWFNMVNSNLEGTANIQNAIGATPNDWLRDFTAAMYAADNSFVVAAAYQTPSWNFRSVFVGLGGFPLLPRPLTDGVGLTLSYATGGGTAYTRFGTSANTFSTVTGLSGGVPPVSPYSLIVVRTK